MSLFKSGKVATVDSNEDIIKIDNYLSAVLKMDYSAEIPEFQNPIYASVVSKIKQYIQYNLNQYGKIAKDINNLMYEETKTAITLDKLDVRHREINSNINQLTTLVENLADEVVHMAGMVSNTAEDTARGSETMRITQSGMEQISEGNTSSSESLAVMNEQMNYLDQSTSNIDSLADKIVSIAKQTNLLALNASIEASHAGELGKGFAVVAEEVAKLAEQSRNSVDEINGQLSAIRSEVDELSRKLHTLDDTFVKNTETINKTSENTSELTEVFSNIGDAMNQIAPITQQQAATFEEMAASLKSALSDVHIVSDDTHGCNKEIFRILNDVSDMRNIFLKSGMFKNEDFIDIVKVDHLMWIPKVNQMLWGNLKLDVEVAGDYRNCRMGKWYSGKGKERYGNHPIYAEIGASHERFHKCCADIIAANRDKDQHRIDALFVELEKISNEVLEKLDRLKSI